MKFIEALYEKEKDLAKSYSAELEQGDEILIGKYRNKLAVIKGFSKDKNEQPVMATTKGERKVYAFRLKDKKNGDKT